jgi:Mannosyl-glycoprotein endo-beta-N-acetylglucosaminidase
MFRSRSRASRGRVSRRLAAGAAVLVLAAAVLAGCRLPIKPQTGASPTSVTGPPALSAAQIVAWFKAKAPSNARYSASVPIEQLVETFLQEAADENVRGDIAFAQSVIETRYFAYGGQVQAWQNNYAGIGACDSCHGGIAFPDARTGVRAQIQLLRNFADTGSRSWNLEHPLVTELFPTAKSYDEYRYKGRAPDWFDMGNGNWASSPDYANTVLTKYNAMRTYNGLPPVAQPVPPTTTTTGPPT